MVGLSLRKHNSKAQRPPPLNELQQHIIPMLERIAAELVRQSKWAFNISMFTATTGTLLILTGLVLAQQGKANIATYSAAVGTLTDLTSGVVFIIYKANHAALNNLIKSLTDTLVGPTDEHDN